jgi:D-arabinan exo alpha-(1,3)/(1,5)-arabinofuranosidase (non-reducing end)
VTDRPFDHLLHRGPGLAKRASSWDRSGGNHDFIRVEPGQTATLLDVPGAGRITHFYCALIAPDPAEYRDAILRMYWDGAGEPSVAAPLGDFLGVIQGRVREVRSAVLSVNPGFGVSHGLNLYFPMPFSDGARITLENRGPVTLGGPLKAFWFHIDHELYPDPPPGHRDLLRFHAAFRQERPTTAVGDEPNEQLPGGVNLTGAENYVALDARGEGHMAGLVLEVDNLQGRRWYGEGDDMVFVDDDAWPPSIHGTGTEEIFGGGACPDAEYSAPYTGFHLIESSDYDGLTGMYRWFIHDPIRFSRQLRWTIEHGHANNFANYYASVAYWYQQPLAAADPLPSREELLPRLDGDYEQARALLLDTLEKASGPSDYPGAPHLLHLRTFQAGRSFSAGRWSQAVAELTAFRQVHGLE